MEHNSHTTIKQYFEDINLSVLPSNVADYIRTHIISDPDSLSMSTDDEYFIEIKEFIEQNYPAALVKEAPIVEEAPAKTVEEEIKSVERKIKGYTLKLRTASADEKASIERKIKGYKLKLKSLESKKEKGGTVTLSYKAGDPTSNTGETIATVDYSVGDPEQMTNGGLIKHAIEYLKHKGFDIKHNNGDFYYIDEEEPNVSAKGVIDFASLHGFKHQIHIEGHAHQSVIKAIQKAHHMLEIFRMLGDNDIVTPSMIQGWRNTHLDIKNVLEAEKNKLPAHTLELLKELEHITDRIQKDHSKVFNSRTDRGIYIPELREEARKWLNAHGGHKFEDGGEMESPEHMAKGGGFEKLAHHVAHEYEGHKVPAKYQKVYHEKRYSHESAEEVGRKVAAKVYREQQSHK